MFRQEHIDLIFQLLSRVIRNQEIYMSGLTDLQAAVEANTAATAAVVAALGSVGDSDAAVETAAQTVAANTAALVAATPVVAVDPAPVAT